MKRPLRIWMTGCVAVVSLALFNPRDPRPEAADVEQGDALRSAWRVSSSGLVDTVRRLEASAQQHGLAVFARFAAGTSDPGSPPRAGNAGGASASTVLVFASTNGATPVVMDGDEARPALPLSLVVRERADGRAEVLMPRTPALPRDAWPADVARELRSLSEVMAAALSA